MTIPPEKIMPLLMMTANFIASVIYFWRGIPRLGCYWMFAGTLTYCIIFWKDQWGGQ